MFNDKLIEQAVNTRDRRRMIDNILVENTPCDLQKRIVGSITFELMEKVMDIYHKEMIKNGK